MVTANVVKGLSDRYTKAEALVAAGAVFPVSGLTGYGVVRNGDGTQMYLVRFEAGHEHCTCPDFKERQGRAGLPCKHILAAELALGSTPRPEGHPAPAPAADPAKLDAGRACGMLAAS